MGFKLLLSGEMISNSQSWIDETHDDCRTLLATPQTAVLVPILKEAHQELVSTQPAPAPQVTDLVVLATAAHNRHGDLVRGIYHALLGYQYLAPDGATAQSYERVRLLVLPEGLAAANKTYREEAGQGVMLKGRMTPDAKAMLTKMKTPDGTLWDAVQELIATAAELGDIENRREQSAAGQATPADHLEARNKWIRAVSALVGIMDLVDPAETRFTAIRDRVREASKRSDQRAAAAAKEAAPPTTTTTTTTPPANATNGATPHAAQPPTPAPPAA